jgi:hypothetical protein
MKNIAITVKDYLHAFLIYIVLTLVSLVFTFQVFFIGLTFTGNSDLIGTITNFITTTFDGHHTDNPSSIWYSKNEGITSINIESVVNNVKIGSMASNRNLAFGVRNILEEYLQENNIDINPNSENSLVVEIIYLDILSTKKNISIIHSGEEEVVIRLKGTLYKNGDKKKEVFVEESSSEVSMSTLIIDQGGKFNQTSLSNAIKKSCDKLIQKILK